MASSADYRTACFDAKGAECILCGSERNVVAHHIDGDRDNNEIGNLIPVCRACHSSIHGGGVDGLSEQLPPESRTDLLPRKSPGMRPNIDISHTLNGRVKDYASDRGLDLSEAYRRIIERGLEELEAEGDGE